LADLAAEVFAAALSGRRRYRSETTLTQRWPDGRTSLSYRFPRDVSTWCRLYDQSGSIVALVSFPGAWSGARARIAETADKWARHLGGRDDGPPSATSSEADGGVP
jgi:hypothetical protein